MVSRQSSRLRFKKTQFWTTISRVALDPDPHLLHDSANASSMFTSFLDGDSRPTKTGKGDKTDEIQAYAEFPRSQRDNLQFVPARDSKTFRIIQLIERKSNDHPGQ
mmetsp:Transcript_13612/g.31641  ORF Transcript_13612/g.31641 Transcript_13612/m.31641 type:complete len:106 (-) Transcript_13612:1110-1427(-)